MLKFSAIIPTYNREKFLIKSITSVLKQSHKPCEIIVIDDANSFETEKIINEFIEKNLNIKFIYLSNKKNKGALYSRNYGSTFSTGEYLAFLDDDDVWDKNYLKKANDHLMEKNYDILISKIVSIKLNGSTEDKLIPNIFSIEDYLFGNPGVLCSNVIIKKSCFEDLEGYDKKISGAADKDLFIRACLKNYKYVVLNDNKIFYQIHDNQWSDDYKKIFFQKLYFFLKYIKYYLSFKKLYKIFKLLLYYLYLSLRK